MTTNDTPLVLAEVHKPDPKRVGSHCRTDCSCGWRGPQVPMYGDGYPPWYEHFKDAEWEDYKRQHPEPPKRITRKHYDELRGGA